MAEETVAALSYAHQHEETQLTEEITLLREQLQLMQVQDRLNADTLRRRLHVRLLGLMWGYGWLRIDCKLCKAPCASCCYEKVSQREAPETRLILTRRLQMPVYDVIHAGAQCGLDTSDCV